MNRLVLIGNGFDLAHDLKTSYADFIDWYWEKRYKELLETHNNVSEDCLLTIQYQEHSAISTYLENQLRYNLTFRGLTTKGKIDWIIGNVDEFYSRLSPLFKRILLGVNSKTWGGIEQDYYDLLKEYAFRDPKDNKAEPPIKALNQQLRYLQQLLVEYLAEVGENKVKIIPSILNALYAPIMRKMLLLRAGNIFKLIKNTGSSMKKEMRS